MEIVVATNNKDKVKEYQEMLSPLGIKVITLASLNINVDPEETGTTFKENSYIKASEIAKYTNLPVIADDSGLVIDALPNVLGVYSKRFLSENATYEERMSEIIRLLQGKQRTARFVCCLTLVNYDKQPLFFEGVCEGTIDYKYSGNGGFGYDPCFIPLGSSVSMGHYSDEEKNKISHRGRACQKLIKYLSENKRANYK